MIIIGTLGTIEKNKIVAKMRNDEDSFEILRWFSGSLRFSQTTARDRKFDILSARWYYTSPNKSFGIFWI